MYQDQCCWCTRINAADVPGSMLLWSSLLFILSDIFPEQIRLSYANHNLTCSVLNVWYICWYHWEEGCAMYPANAMIRATSCLYTVHNTEKTPRKQKVGYCRKWNVQSRHKHLLKMKMMQKSPWPCHRGIEILSTTTTHTLLLHIHRYYTSTPAIKSMCSGLYILYLTWAWIQGLHEVSFQPLV